MTDRAPERPGSRTPGQDAAAIIDEIHRLLARLPLAPPVAPGLALSPAVCRTLEETLGIGTTRSGSELVRAVERLASVEIGEIKIPFTPGQFAEIKHRASKRGRTVAEELKAVVDRIRDEIFYKGG